MRRLTHSRATALTITLLCAGVLTIAQPLLRGTFAADVEMTSRAGDPLRLGVHGGVGPDLAPPSNSMPPVNVVGNNTPPFDGPTAAEKAAIDNLRAATHAQWTQILATMSRNGAEGMHGAEGEEQAIRASEPRVAQPLRHLTPYEIAAINAEAAAIRRSVAAAR